MSERKDLTGLRFTRLLVINYAGNNKDGRATWLCKCDCGAYHTTLGKYLLDGSTTSCGCRRATFLKGVVGHKPPLHGMTNTRIYQIWQGMRNRCHNPREKAYKNYGGRGISICKEWDDFTNFYNWAMDNGYSKELTIDRIDSDGNYAPDNCRWADRKTQGNNTRRNHKLTYKGVTKTMSEWAESEGIEYSTLRARINSYHWSTEKAIETPVRKIKKRKG